jgi:hypothetical protein
MILIIYYGGTKTLSSMMTGETNGDIIRNDHFWIIIIFWISYTTLNLLKIYKYKSYIFKSFIIIKINWRLIIQVFIFDSMIIDIERYFWMDEKGYILIEKLISESHFIIPVENIIITEIWINLIIYIGSNRIIYNLHSKFHYNYRVIYSISINIYSIFPNSIIIIIIRVMDYIIGWEWKYIR